MFARDGEDALPGMDALVSLTSLELTCCSSQRVLPMSLSRLTQLRCLRHYLSRNGLPGADLPAGAPCYASLTRLCLEGHNLPAFPAGILALTRLTFLTLPGCCFEQLPEAVSALTALEDLRLGRHTADDRQIGGALDARAPGQPS